MGESGGEDVGALDLGQGINDQSAIFSLADGQEQAPIPWQDPDEIVPDTTLAHAKTPMHHVTTIITMAAVIVNKHMLRNSASSSTSIGVNTREIQARMWARAARI